MQITPSVITSEAIDPTAHNLWAVRSSLRQPEKGLLWCSNAGGHPVTRVWICMFSSTICSFSLWLSLPYLYIKSSKDLPPRLQSTAIQAPKRTVTDATSDFHILDHQSEAVGIQLSLIVIVVATESLVFLTKFRLGVSLRLRVKSGECDSTERPQLLQVA